MKILNWHVHLIISKREIPAVKLTGLRQGICHVHYDPIRKEVPAISTDPPSLPLPLDVFPAEPIGADFPIPGVPVEEFK